MPYALLFLVWLLSLGIIIFQFSHILMRMKCSFLFITKNFSLECILISWGFWNKFPQTKGLKQQKCILSTVLEAESPKFQKTTLFPGAIGEKLLLPLSSSWQKCGILYLLLHHNLCLCGQRASSSSLQVSNQVTIMVFKVHLKNPGLPFH